MSTTALVLPADYADWLSSLKQRIRGARQRALLAAFPDIKGHSASNLKYMCDFAQEWPRRQIGQQSADQLPWFHIVTLIIKLAATDLRNRYTREALDNAWPRETFEAQFKSQPHLRQGAAVTEADIATLACWMEQNVKRMRLAWD